MRAHSLILSLLLVVPIAEGSFSAPRRIISKRATRLFVGKVRPGGSSGGDKLGDYWSQFGPDISDDETPDNEGSDVNNLDPSWPFRPDISDDNSPSAIDKAQILAEGEYGKIYSFDLNEYGDYLDDEDAWQLLLGKLRIKGRNKECILCLHRFKIWWMRPVHLRAHGANEDEFSIPHETLMILGRSENADDATSYRIVLPIVLPDDDKSDNINVLSSCTTCTLRPSTASSAVYLTSESGGTVAMYCGTGSDPYALIQEGASMAANLMRLRRSGQHLADSSSLPDQGTSRSEHPLLRALGWCTWNSFYTDLDGNKIVSGLRKLYDSGVPKPLGFVVIDDGWQHTTNDNAQEGSQWGERLKSLAASQSKFGSGTSTSTSCACKSDLLSFEETISLLKAPYDKGGGGVQSVLAWHALPGYWLGVNETSFEDFDANTYFPKFPSGILKNDPSAAKEQSVNKGIGIPGNAANFFQKYHSFLSKAGVDGIKVDAQGVSGTLRRAESTDAHRHQVTMALHEALASSIESNFDSKKASRIIHCMCHSPEIFYNLPALYEDRPLMRASDDYYPTNEFSHGPHIVDCAFNSLLFSQYAIPDWDMFTTADSPSGGIQNTVLQAIVRSISGAPVYISDVPGTSDITKLQKLVCIDGSTLVCEGPLLPVRDCILVDPLSDSNTLVLWNTNKLSGVLGVFRVAGSTWDYEELNYVHIGNGDEYDNDSLVKEQLRVEMIESFRESDVRNNQFLAYSSIQEWVKLLPSIYQPFDADIQSRADVITVIPIINVDTVEIAAIGYRGMYNPGGCIASKPILSGDNINQVSFKVSGCGKFIFAIRNGDIRKVEIDGVIVDVRSSDINGAEGFQILEFDVVDTSVHDPKTVFLEVEHY